MAEGPGVILSPETIRDVAKHALRPGGFECDWDIGKSGGKPKTCQVVLGSWDLLRKVCVLSSWCAVSLTWGVVTCIFYLICYQFFLFLFLFYVEWALRLFLGLLHIFLAYTHPLSFSGKTGLSYIHFYIFHSIYLNFLALEY